MTLSLCVCVVSSRKILFLEHGKVLYHLIVTTSSLILDCRKIGLDAEGCALYYVVLDD